MRIDRLIAGWKGAVLGLGVTGGWLLADLLLPEPWGDYFLFGALAVVNVAAGWKLAVMHAEKEREASEVRPIGAGSAVPSESD